MNGNGYRLLASMVLALGCAMSGHADSFHGTTFMGANDTEMVGIGYAGNPDDPLYNEEYDNYYGAVGYNYWIGKTEVSADQFAASGVIADYGGGDTPAVYVTLLRSAEVCQLADG